MHNNSTSVLPESGFGLIGIFNSLCLHKNIMIKSLTNQVSFNSPCEYTLIMFFFKVGNPEFVRPLMCDRKKINNLYLKML